MARSTLNTPFGIALVGFGLLGMCAIVGVLICSGSVGGNIYRKLPEIVFAPKPVPIAATKPRLPTPAGMPEPAAPPPAPVPDPEPTSWWPLSAPDPAPRQPEPQPLPPPDPVPVIVDAVPVPVPVQPVVSPLPVTGAMISLSGDAVSVRAYGPKGNHRIPGMVPPGTYDVVVTFAGREPFAASTLLVLDTKPRSVICRSSLGICKVR